MFKRLYLAITYTLNDFNAISFNDSSLYKVLYYAWVTCVNKCTLPHYSRSSINSEKRRQSENGIRDRTLVDLYELTNRFHVAVPLFGNTS